METFIIFWFGFILGLSAIVLLYRKRIDTLESGIDTKINLQECKKKAEAFYSRHETFPQYLERVGAITKPKFELSEELKAKYGSFGDIPRTTRHMDEKEILDKFDIDIAKTCEGYDKEIHKDFEKGMTKEEYDVFRSYYKLRGTFYWKGGPFKSAVGFKPHETFPLDKNGNGGC